ncbi:hypothetical protein A3SI_12229 [Nitritalea halalkaliphila LW7]|uniref:Uncharacterized protein n=1 Tax=Nitritalea halalkaliphila LW7 TaxID=1189621 RepID=I5C1W1_9BACT|nr:hypothetical protein [Nitritalea halalkaliphila]EIM75813.1 hypothetical protein A3SI_12229 [Nitritalea halalkaliphila LW7]
MKFVEKLDSEEMHSIHGGTLWNIGRFMDYLFKAEGIRQAINDFVDGFNETPCSCEEIKEN